MKVEGSRVLITGGAGGIGAATCLDLARRGALVLAVDLDGAALDRLAGLARDRELALDLEEADISREGQVIDLMAACRSRMGGLDVVINNAGAVDHGAVVKPGPDGLEKMSLQRWQRVIDVDLTGVFLCSREAAGVMIEQDRGGLIINISSFWRQGQPLQSAYSAAKAGVAALTVAWAGELASYGIRSMAIAPGYIDTPMTGLIPAPVRRKIAAEAIPLGRFGRPEEVAGAIRFIIENDYLSGRVLELDGGARV